MSFFDDLKKQAEAKISSIGATAQTWLAAQIPEPLVKIAAQLPSGNLSAAQIQAGARGATAPVAPSPAPAAAIANASTTADNSGFSVPPIAIAIAAAGAAYLLLKGK